jgi:hypothetical protein
MYVRPPVGMDQLGSHWTASHKSNPSQVPQGYVEIRTLGNAGGANRCGGDTP